MTGLMRCSLPVAAALLALLPAGAALGSPSDTDRPAGLPAPALLRDIDPSFAESQVAPIFGRVRDAASFQGRLVYTDCDPASGCQPWARDIASAEASMLVDLGFAGAQAPHCYVAGKDKLFFRALSNWFQSSLWMTDGTPEGTSQFFPARDLRVHGCVEAVIGGDVLLFAGRQPGIWRSDGTPSGTWQVSNARKSDHLYYSKMLPIGDVAYFSACENPYGCEPWISDGTVGGTHRIADIAPGWESSYPGPFVEWKGDIYFLAAEELGELDLWRVRPSGAERVFDSPAVSENYDIPPQLEATESGLFFALPDATDMSVWFSDGTAAGTRFLVRSSWYVFPLFAAQHGAAFFGEGGDLWVTRGLAENTLPIPGVRWREYSSPLRARLGASVLFEATHGGTLDIWSSDGTVEGTRKLSDSGVVDDYRAEIQFMTAIGDQVFFQIRDADEREWLWSTDGTPEGTEILAQINPGPSGSKARSFTCVDSDLLFAATDSEHGEELWRAPLNGSSAPELVTDLRPGPLSSELTFVGGLTGAVVFHGRAANSNRGLFALDLGAGSIQSLMSSPGNAEVQLLGRLPGAIVVGGVDSPSTAGKEIVVTDGSLAGTDIVDIAGVAAATDGVTFGGKVAFRVQNGDYSLSYWSLSGRSEPPVPFCEVGAGPGLGFFEDAVVLGGKILNDSWEEEFGRSLWAIDDDASQSSFLADLSDTYLSNHPIGVRFRNRLFFADFANGDDERLFSTSDTPGTLVDVGGLGGTEAFVPNPLRASLRHVYALGWSPETGSEIWASDGVSPPALLLDIQPGPLSSSVREMTVAGPRLFFVANDAVHGSELWTSLGTPESTQLVVDLYQGAGSSNPNSLTFCGGRLFFSAYTEESGYEPYSMLVLDAPFFADSFEEGMTSAWSATVP